ncbi:unnamed protein product [Didymodactylos carnosus]|nr:unnamed protein product [Didymodactylos carnosus]CAF3832288.1 unnamed protein product [Didymodactylos carnosus]
MKIVRRRNLVDKDPYCDYINAIENYEKSLEQQLKSMPSNNSELAETYNLIGTLYIKIENYDKASQYYNNILQCDVYNHIAAYSNIAFTNIKLGNQDIALAFHSKVLDIKRKNELEGNKLTDRELVCIYQNAALIHLENECDEALQYYKDAIKIAKQSDEIPCEELAILYYSIAATYISKENYYETQAYLKEAIDLWESVLPLEHPDLQRAYESMGISLLRSQNFSEALIYLKKTLDIKLKLTNSDFNSLIILFNYIGISFLGLEQYEEALDRFTKALKILLEHTTSTDHCDQLATLYGNIAITYCNLSNLSDALTNYLEVLHLLELHMPSSLSQLEIVLEKIANLHLKLNNETLALNYFHQLRNIQLKISSSSSSTNVLRTCNTLKCIIEIYENQNKYECVMKYLNEILTIQLNEWSTDYNQHSITYYKLGSVLRETKSFEDALIHFQKAYDACLKNIPINYFNLSRISHGFGEVYHDLCDYKKALYY